MFYNKLKAFTLAEVLIVIGIIGVIATLTIPNLSKETNNKETVAAVKKAYATFSEVLNTATATYGPMDTWFLGCTGTGNTYNNCATQILGDRLTSYLNVVKNCGMITGCWTSTSPKTLSGAADNYSNTTTRYKVILSDGSYLLMKIESIESGYFLIDVNGKQGKTVKGKDTFIFNFNPKINEMYFTMPSTSDLDNSCNINVSTSSGNRCTEWIINNNNMDYLTVDSSGKCSDGTTLNWDNPNCYN